MLRNVNSVAEGVHTGVPQLVFQLDNVCIYAGSVKEMISTRARYKSFGLIVNNMDCNIIENGWKERFLMAGRNLLPC